MYMKKILSLCVATTISCSAFAEPLDIQTMGLVQAGGKPVVLLGKQVNLGDDAPEFKVVDERFSPVKLSDFANKTVLISVVPSLDTGICSLQTKRFNEEVSNLPENVVMLTISNDLPFAQKRFCKAESINDLIVLSDSVWRDFGANYGLLIKDMGLLTRAIFVIDNTGKIAYKELVADMSSHPDYDAALLAVNAITTAAETAEADIDALGSAVEKAPDSEAK
jgi:thiol peroxidase